MSTTIYDQNERSSGRYTATLTDETGTAVSALASLVVWLRDVATGTTINSRSNQSLLNANGGTFAAGAFVWQMDPADHAFVGVGKTVEIHEAVFLATWDGGAKARSWSVQWKVKNMAPIT